MRKNTVLLAGLVLAAGISPTVLAGDDAVIGALLGAGVGAAIGHGVGGDRGAIIGGAVGAVAGVSIANANGRHDRTHYATPRPYYAPPAPAAYYDPDDAPEFERYRDPVVEERIDYPPRRHRHERRYRDDRCDDERDDRSYRYRERHHSYRDRYNWR